MKDTFTTDDYLQAIDRELAKRATTYPKIIEKKSKSGIDSDELKAICKKMKQQANWLKNTKTAIEMGCPIVIEIDSIWIMPCLLELIRELKMRKSYYPRLIYFKRLDQETADYQIAVWESLTRWFAKQYLDLDELPTKRTRKLIQCPQCQFDWSKQEIKNQSCTVCGYEKDKTT